MRSGYCSQSAPERAMTARVAAGSRVAPEMWVQGGAPPPPPPPGAFGTRSFDLQTHAHGQSRYTPGSPTYLAEAPAVRTILLTERARLARWAFIDGAWPRGSRWDRWQRSGVTTTPRRLAAGRGAEALPTNPTEPTPTYSAGGRRSVIVTRPELRLHAPPPVSCRAAPLLSQM